MFDGRILHRIKALKDFGNVKKGDLGGFIESEKNLSYEGLCWIFDNAKVFKGAEVYGNAQIYGNAEIFGVVLISGNDKIFGDSRLCE